MEVVVGVVTTIDYQLVGDIQIWNSQTCLHEIKCKQNDKISYNLFKGRQYAQLKFQRLQVLGFEPLISPMISPMINQILNQWTTPSKGVQFLSSFDFNTSL
jgi:hypothetical protein